MKWIFWMWFHSKYAVISETMCKNIWDWERWRVCIFCLFVSFDVCQPTKAIKVLWCISWVKITPEPIKLCQTLFSLISRRFFFSFLLYFLVLFFKVKFKFCCCFSFRKVLFVRKIKPMLLDFMKCEKKLKCQKCAQFDYY